MVAERTQDLGGTLFRCIAKSDRRGAALSHGLPTRNERAVAAGAFGILALLRVAYVFREGFNSDEPQHLHIVWGWTRGLVQYRDLFDNHMPLFHLASVLPSPTLSFLPIPR
jgi:hypothetical protein